MAKNPSPARFAPHNHDAEASVIGAILLDNRAFARVSELQPEDFHHPRYRAIFEAMRALAERGEPLDVVTLEVELRRQKLSSKASLATFSDVTAVVPTINNVEAYAARVRDMAAIRNTVVAMNNAMAEARMWGWSSVELVSDIRARLAQIELHVGDGTKTMWEVMKSTTDALQARAAAAADGHPGLIGIPTGLLELDALTGGITEGVLTVVAGRPSHGKSSLTRTFADAASERGVHVHVFSMEDTHQTYGMRVLSDHTRIDLHTLRTMNGVTHAQGQALGQAADKIAQRKTWFVDDDAGLTPEEIVARARRHAPKVVDGKRPKWLVIADYLTKVRVPRVRDEIEKVNYALEVTERFARDEGVAFVWVSQLNRECEKREDKRPMLSDLRESGRIEESAESVLLVTRPELYLSAKNDRHKAALAKWRGKGTCIVAKHKNSAVGEIDLCFDARTATYRNLDTRRDEEDY
jgi:replicative DNA helicase